MIFNSLEFIAIFLPIAFGGFLLAARVGGRETLPTYIAIVSVIFYAQFSSMLALILCVSVAFNYCAGAAIIRARKNGSGAAGIMTGAIIANIFALGYFKYTNFLIDVANDLGALGIDHLNIILPVGISFYTFVQIGYLVDCYSGQIEERPTLARYAVFAAFFPAVTAGPLVLSREMLGQMNGWKAFEPRRLGVGVAIFAAGLFKKVVLADAIAPFANGAFDGVAAGVAIDAITAWTGSVAYALQLYFDFSGYSDMAIGLGLIFGLRLPLNFNSPFKATSISEFWRRWHMTMTRFFTTYLYTPMAVRGMRKAMANQSSRSSRFVMTAGGPVLFTFIVAGIWHGAGWTFVVYGLIHGVALAINHAWREFKMPEISEITGWALTMGVVISGLVVFRAPDMATAISIWMQMWSFGLLDPAAGTQMVQLDLINAAGFITVLGAIVMLMPNTQELVGSDRITSDGTITDRLPEALRWRPSWGWAVTAGVLVVIGVGKIGADSSFLYYQF